MTGVELKPCPFCGHAGPRLERVLRNGYAEDQDDPDAFAYYHVCPGCATQGPWTKSQTSAEQRWNMRP